MSAPATEDARFAAITGTLVLVMNLGCVFLRITLAIIAVVGTKRIRDMYDQLQQIFLFVEDNLISAIWKTFNV